MVNFVMTPPVLKWKQNYLNTLSAFKVCVFAALLTSCTAVSGLHAVVLPERFAGPISIFLIYICFP